MPKLPSLRKPAEPPPEEPAGDAPAPAPHGPRFSLRTLLMVTLVVAVACAGYGGMRRDSEDTAFYVLFAAAAPVVVAALVGVVLELIRSRRR